MILFYLKFWYNIWGFYNLVSQILQYVNGLEHILIYDWKVSWETDLKVKQNKTHITVIFYKNYKLFCVVLINLQFQLENYY